MKTYLSVVGLTSLFWGAVAITVLIQTGVLRTVVCVGSLCGGF